MFVCSVRASTIKFFALIAVALAVLITLVAIGEGDTVYASAGVEINYGNIKTKEDRLAFISGFGLTADSESETEEGFSMPESLDRALLGYNEIQRSQGLDLSKYLKKRVTHYSYRITNYEAEGEVRVNLLVYKNRIIACDISSAEGEGFVLPLTELDSAKIKQAN